MLLLRALSNVQDYKKVESEQKTTNMQSEHAKLPLKKPIVTI